MSAMEVGLDRVVGELVEKLVRFWAVGLKSEFEARRASVRDHKPVELYNRQ